MLQHSITHHVPSRCYNSGRGGMAVGTRGAPPPFKRDERGRRRKDQRGDKRFLWMPLAPTTRRGRAKAETPPRGGDGWR